MAYASLGTCYFNLGETTLASENLGKAYELRERVSEREKFYIESKYHLVVIGDLEKARQLYELWAQVFIHEIQCRTPTWPLSTGDWGYLRNQWSNLEKTTAWR